MQQHQCWQCNPVSRGVWEQATPVLVYDQKCDYESKHFAYARTAGLVAHDFTCWANPYTSSGPLCLHHKRVHHKQHGQASHMFNVKEKLFLWC